MNRKKFADPTTTYNINRINSKPAKDTFTEIGLQTGASIPCRNKLFSITVYFYLTASLPERNLDVPAHIPKKGAVTTHLSQNSNNFLLYLLL